jgi:catalase (peroxidase I)
MHLGIIACMGLVCFGLLMIGADCTCLRDEDYRSLARRFRSAKEHVLSRSWSPLPARGMTPVSMTAGQDGAADA